MWYEMCSRITHFLEALLMIRRWNVTVPELTGRQKRRAYVYLPESYKYDKEKHYPVLYMFDGHNVFFDDDATYGKSWGMKDYMDYTQTQLIIAAVECNHSPDGGRLSEYCPFDFDMEDGMHIEGRGRQTMNWFVRFFKPYIDHHYRTIPDREHTFIAGSSMGGLMSLYAVLKYNYVFGRAAALSPSLWTNSDEAYKMIYTSKPAVPTIVYMDYGSEEMENRRAMFKAYGRATSLLLDKKIMLNSRIVPYGDHSEASWEKQLPFFMGTLMYGMED